MRHEFIDRSSFRPITNDQRLAGPITIGHAQNENGWSASDIRRSLDARLKRTQYLDFDLISDPSWDILLELYFRELSERRITVSRLAERSGAPMTTAIRHIKKLEFAGLVTRSSDPLDARRHFVALSGRGVTILQAYFRDLPADTRLL